MYKLKTLKFNGLLFLLFFLIEIILTMNVVLAENSNYYQNNEISLKYPSDWKIYNASSLNMKFSIQSPEWSNENIGTTIRYFLINGDSYIVLNDTYREIYIKSFIDSSNKDSNNKVEVTSSEIINQGNFSAIKIEFNRTLYGKKFKEEIITIADGNRQHVFEFASLSIEDYNKYIPIFREVVDSLNIKYPHNTIYYQTYYSSQNAGYAFGQNLRKYTWLIITVLSVGIVILCLVILIIKKNKKTFKSHTTS